MKVELSCTNQACSSLAKRLRACDGLLKNAVAGRDLLRVILAGLYPSSQALARAMWHLSISSPCSRHLPQVRGLGTLQKNDAKPPSLSCYITLELNSELWLQ